MTFLTPAEVAQLSGYKRGAEQRAWLDRNGITYRQSGSGRPIVHISAIDKNWRPLAGPARAPFVPPQLDREAVFRPLPEIRARRVKYALGDGPDGSGIYFLFVRWALVYVGQSGRISFRLRDHFMKRVTDRQHAIWFNKVTTIEVPRYWVADVEHFYINEYRPRFNRRLTPQHLPSATDVLI